jgi:hypothetical protein
VSAAAAPAERQEAAQAILDRVVDRMVAAGYPVEATDKHGHAPGRIPAEQTAWPADPGAFEHQLAWALIGGWHSKMGLIHLLQLCREEARTAAGGAPEEDHSTAWVLSCDMYHGRKGCGHLSHPKYSALVRTVVRVPPISCSDGDYDRPGPLLAACAACGHESPLGEAFLAAVPDAQRDRFFAEVRTRRA